MLNKDNRQKMNKRLVLSDIIIVTVDCMLYDIVFEDQYLKNIKLFFSCILLSKSSLIQL